MHNNDYIYFHDQMLIGSVFSGSSLTKSPHGKNYYLSMRSNNKEWLYYKCHIMKEYFADIYINEYAGTYRVNSTTHSMLTNFYKILYRNNQRYIDELFLERISDTALATWYLDNGGRIGRNNKNIYLNTTLLGKSGSKKISCFFNSLDISCNINDQKNRIRITFTVDGSMKFLRLIKHRIPNFMFNRV